VARLNNISFELNALAVYEVSAVAGSPVIQSAVAISGVYALQITSLSSGVVKTIRQEFVAADNNGPFFIRTDFRVDTAPSAENRIILVNDTNDAVTPQVYITIDNGRLLRLYDEDGVIGSASSALTLTARHRIELEINRVPAAGSQVVRARLDGVEFAGSATRDLSVGFEFLLLGGNLASEAQTTGNWYFDNVAVNNNTGSSETSYPGDGEQIFLRPNAAGDLNTWARGGADSGANWSQTEEVTPNDATDFVLENTTNADPALCSDMYNLEATPAALASDDVINLVAVGFRCAVDVATGADPDIVLRIAKEASGTVEESAAIDVNNTSWRTHNSGALLNYLLTLYDEPGASTTAWTKATLDTAQIGVRLSVTDTHNAQVTAIWLLVDHKPAAAAAGNPWYAYAQQ